MLHRRGDQTVRGHDAVGDAAGGIDDGGDVVAILRRIERVEFLVPPAQVVVGLIGRNGTYPGHRLSSVGTGGSPVRAEGQASRLSLRQIVILSSCHRLTY